MSPLAHQLVHAAVERYGDRVATIDTDGGQKTFTEIWERARTLAGGLRELGVTPGTRVVGVMPNRSEWLEFDAAVSMIGGLRARMNARDSAREFTWILNDVEPAVVIAGPGHGPVIERLVADGAVPATRVLVLGDGGSYEKLIGSAEPVDPVPFDPDTPYVIMHTSGTTGNYKGAVYSHRQWSNNYRNLLATLFGDSEGGAFLHVVPVSHQSGLFIAPALFRGMSNVMMGAFSVPDFLDLVERHRITHTVVAPTIVNMIAAHPDVRTRDLSSLRSVVYAGSAIAPDPLRRALDVFGPILTQGYGNSEAGTSYNLLLHPQAHVVGLAGRPEILSSAGRANPYYDVKVADDDGVELGPGESGELWVRGDAVSSGYWRQPEATARAYVDGWFRTGDVAVATPDGYVTIVDRKNDMIITGGLNVYPREVEDVVAGHPAVREVAVIAVPDEKWGEAVTACVSLNDGATLTLEDVQAHCAAAGLASYKKPLHLHVVDEIPKTAVGKLSRRALRDPFWQGQERHVG